MCSYLPNYKCYIIPAYIDHNESLESYESDLYHSFDSILMSSDAASGFDLKFDDDGDLVIRCYGSTFTNQDMKIKECKIVAVNDENERVNIYNEIFKNEQEHEETLEVDAYELE